MRDYLPLDEPLFIVLLLILLGVAIRFFVRKFFNFIDRQIEKRGKKPFKLYLFFVKCCMIVVNLVIPFVIFTFIMLILGD